MTREECVDYQIEVETENFKIMTECLTSGKHAEMKAAKNPVEQKNFWIVTKQRTYDKLFEDRKITEEEMALAYRYY